MKVKMLFSTHGIHSKVQQECIHQTEWMSSAKQSLGMVKPQFCACDFAETGTSQWRSLHHFYHTCELAFKIKMTKHVLPSTCRMCRLACSMAAPPFKRM
jgi:hypothetical protein